LGVIKIDSFSPSRSVQNNQKHELLTKKPDYKNCTRKSRINNKSEVFEVSESPTRGQLLFGLGCETLTSGKAMGTIPGLNLICLLATCAFAQDHNYPAALGTALPPMNSSGPPPGLNYGAFPVGDGYWNGLAYGYAAQYPNAQRVVKVVLIQHPPVPTTPPGLCAN
jgi:hypothetical protein